MNIGIDKMSFYVPHLVLDMAALAEARGIDPDKYRIGLGQVEMAVAPLTQDVVSMAVNAAKQCLTPEDIAAIDLVLFGTETGIDFSKSAAVYVHQLLGLPKHARAVELKQACYAGTAGLQFARGHIALHPDKKVLVLAADIAKYGLNTPGEATQGAGAVALLVSANPRIAVFSEESSYITEDIMDFWRPTYSDTAFADGKYSTEQYLKFFTETWSSYATETGADLAQLAMICCHMPYTKLANKALRQFIQDADVAPEIAEQWLARFDLAKQYNARVGNIYTGSLYLSLISLLEQHEVFPAGTEIGLFSYGSGAVGEFFTLTLVAGYEQNLLRTTHEQLLAERTSLTVAEYEQIFQQKLPQDGSTSALSSDATDIVYLAGVTDHQRLYRQA